MPNIETLRHSLAHILAVVVRELFPGTKFGIGPVIENGFYYDFDFSEVKVINSKLQNPNSKQIQNSNVKNSKQKFILNPNDLPKIEKKMREIIKRDITFQKQIISKEQAKKLFKDQTYKLELINELKEKKATIYKSGDFIDLCRGHHVESAKKINPEAFKLTKIAGAYWRGDEKNPMLTRIYGVAFTSKKDLDNYLKNLEEAEKRDHRQLGQKLDLFHLDEEFGAGLPLWHPKGALLRQIIEDYWTSEHLKNGYELLRTPHIARLGLWQKSGHWDFYRENIYSPMDIEKEKYIIKPMNCPGHILVYKTKIRSYRDLPLRWAELGTVYRYERSGVLHGLTRARGFTQDDAHTFCAPEQLGQEIISTLKFGLKMLKIFGFKEYDIYLSTRPQKYVGILKNWEKATEALEYALKKQGLKYQIDPGEGVFYGPKIDIKIKDSLGRAWQCTTIQVDFNLPEKFAITYIDQKGKKQQPIMIHRALLGSLERFVGVLLEHYAGSLPVWLSPVQVQIIPVGSRHNKYAQKVANSFGSPSPKYLGEGLPKLRFEVKNENETVSKKIREGELQKIPYMLVVGDKEEKNKSVRVRDRKKGDLGMMKIDKFIEKIQKEIESKK
ncbi:MAG: threonine--tRNA ligase [Candidatus Portnoybacteria bacterium RIFCSPLOWO2_01_FULL_38_39]|nr:MAG: threonine--tRNA ligase [Candidatus Portnoybacteria bacterium RIFCSPLOWO2_01_FULL_38_39]